MNGWMNGWVDRWMDEKVFLRYVYTNQKYNNNAEKLANKTQREVTKHTKKLR